MLKLHEVLTTLNDLRKQGDLTQARAFAAQHMDRLDSAELRFNHLLLTAQLGLPDEVMDLLEAHLQAGRWYSRWFLMRAPEFSQFAAVPRFQRILTACDEQEAIYWQTPAAQPILQVPPAAQPPYPLLIAAHGNGFNARHSAEHWACAAQAGWLVFHPQARRMVGSGAHWWAAHEENRAVIVDQAARALAGYAVDPGRFIVGGFSKGGEVAMVLALQGPFGEQGICPKGYITVGAGGYFHLEPELWQPLLQSVPQGLRGVGLYSPYDMGRSGEWDFDRVPEMFRAAGVDARIEPYPGEGHVFPVDFEERFNRAAAFVLGD